MNLANKICKSMYHFDLVVDSYMERSEIDKTLPGMSIEDCLALCLDETSFNCRSVSFNRTGDKCLLSTSSRIQKPGYVRLNTNPNWRIDYYENNCHNGKNFFEIFNFILLKICIFIQIYEKFMKNFQDSYTFSHECREDGIQINVEAKKPYTGVLYGLYDYFTCRIEPKDEMKFGFLFPTVSKNCSDSMTHQVEILVNINITINISQYSIIFKYY